MANKFKPNKPFELNNGSVSGNISRTNRDSQFITNLVREHINIGSVNCQIYLWLGTFQQDDGSKSSLATEHPDKNVLEQFLGIQDTVLLEARDVEYDTDAIPLKGAYAVSQNEVEYARFGYQLANDVLSMDFHIQTMEEQCGRRLMPGDVIELPHLREVDVNGRVANKWYQVSAIVKAPHGYDMMYGFHILSCVLKPARNQQELYDLMNRVDEYGKTLSDQASTHLPMLGITEENQKLAEHLVPTTMFDTSIMYYDIKNNNIIPYKYVDTGKPPNGIPVNAGPNFPQNPTEYEYYVRSDLFPNALYQFYSGRWHRKSKDGKREWQPYQWMPKLREFVSDHGPYDDARPWELRSIHDVLTERENVSNPSPTMDEGIDDQLSVPKQDDGTYNSHNDPLDASANYNLNQPYGY